MAGLAACSEDEPGDKLTVSTVLSTTSTTISPAYAALTPELQQYLTTRTGEVSVAVKDLTTGRTIQVGKPEPAFETASVVRVTLLAMLLDRAESSKRTLTNNEVDLATRMISISDNNATVALWNQLGQAPGMRAFLSQVGARQTQPNNAWGLTATTASDQLQVLRVIAEPNDVLTDTSRSYARELLAKVVPDQRWGVSAGAPNALLKNGWLPRSSGGWVVNSVGFVEGRYAIAVLTHKNSSQAYGIETIEQISALTASAFA